MSKVKTFFRENTLKLLLYMGRWQLSSPILALVLYFFNWNIWIETIVANIIGSLIFFFVDARIFKNNKNKATMSDDDMLETLKEILPDIEDQMNNNAKNIAARIREKFELK